MLQIGVAVAPAGHHPGNIEDIPTQARHYRTSDPLETNIMGTAEMMEDKYSTLVLYQCVTHPVDDDDYDFAQN